MNNYEEIINNLLEDLKKELETEIGETYTIRELCHLCDSLGLNTEITDEHIDLLNSMNWEDFEGSILYYLKINDTELNDYYIEFYNDGGINIIVEKIDKEQDPDSDEFFDFDSKWKIKEIEII